MEPGGLVHTRERESPTRWDKRVNTLQHEPLVFREREKSS